MKPFIVLLSAFGLALLAYRFFETDWDFIFSGNLAMSIMLLFTSIGHFKFRKGMTLMVPPFIPFKNQFVLLTGFIEIAAAIGLMVPILRYLTSLLLIIFFILILPANINAAIKKVNFETGDYNGKGMAYLWFRIPLQLFFIAWTWWFGIHSG